MNKKEKSSHPVHKPIAVTLRLEEQDLLYCYFLENPPSPPTILLVTAKPVLGNESHNSINLYCSIGFMHVRPLFAFLPVLPLFLHNSRAESSIIRPLVFFSLNPGDSQVPAVQLKVLFTTLFIPPLPSPFLQLFTTNPLSDSQRKLTC